MKKFKIIKISLLITITVILGFGMGQVYFNKTQAFASLNSEQMHQRITKNREYAIELATERGEYKCCIHPACTMCYDSPNKWNYGQAGKCFCDEFIARGEEPCPQCQKGQACSSDELIK